MDTDLAALLLALCGLITSAAALCAVAYLKRGARGPVGRVGPEGPPGPIGPSPSVDAVADRVLSLIDPRAGEAVFEMGHRWPVDRVPTDELESLSNGVQILAAFMDRNVGAYPYYLVFGQYDPNGDVMEQFPYEELRNTDIAIGLTEDAIYIVKDRHGPSRVITTKEEL